MKFYKGGTASVSCGLEYNSNHAEIIGTKGMILLPDFVRAGTVYAIRDSKIIREYSDSDTTETKYGYEIKHVTECLEKGLTDSPMYPTWMSFDILDTCDRLRADWHQVYPGDNYIPALPEVKIMPKESVPENSSAIQTAGLPAKLPKLSKAVRKNSAPDW